MVAAVFVGHANPEARQEILATALRIHNRDATNIDLQRVAAACQEFSGAELASLVPAAMFTAYADGARQIVTDDLLAAAAETVPLAKTADKKIAEMRTWAKGRARPASAPEAAPAPTRRALDL